MRLNSSSGLGAKLAACSLLIGGLAGCSAIGGAPAPFPTEHYAVQVQERPDEVALAVHGDGLSTAQQAALADFAGRWRDAGHGAVVLKTPADSTDPEKAKSMAYAVQSQLEALGVPPERIQLAAYQAGGPGSPVVASFLRLTAAIPDCGGGWDNLSSTFSNEPYKHFGCSLTANIATQVADPRDFVSPPGLAPADNVRRQTVLGKYREGKLTAAEKDDQASGAVSTAVK